MSFRSCRRAGYRPPSTGDSTIFRARTHQIPAQTVDCKRRRHHLRLLFAPLLCSPVRALSGLVEVHSGERERNHLFITLASCGPPYLPLPLPNSGAAAPQHLPDPSFDSSARRSCQPPTPAPWQPIRSLSLSHTSSPPVSQAAYLTETAMLIPLTGAVAGVSEVSNCAN